MALIATCSLKEISFALKEKKLQGLFSLWSGLAHVTHFNAELVMLGIAYHHAGLQHGDRQKIEKAFLDGHIQILCKIASLL